MKYAWTVRELAILETTSRVSSVFSLLGACWIILTFLASPSFQKPINRLAFFAAFGNVMTNVATIISRDAIKYYEEGRGYFLCKFQGVFIHWFIMTDALFCAAMAFNVYLTVFRKYSSHDLQRLEIPYILLCYGIPFVPAFVFCFISKTENGVNYPLYGSATLWCWISDKWQILRIATFYAPTWVVLFFTFGIYIRAGKVIFELRDSLRGFAKESTEMSSTAGTIIQSPPIPALSVNGNNHPPDSFKAPLGFTYAPAQLPTPTPPRSSNGNVGNAPNTQGSGLAPIVPIHSDPIPLASQRGHSRNNSNVPSQGYSGYSCTVESAGRPTSGIAAHIAAQRNRMVMEANTAAWAYCRCAMLFFIALVLTWTPSSINRIYTVVYPGAANFGLNFASALVLPCQGLWNGIIYTVTTLPACKELLYRIDDNIRKLLGKEPVNRRRRRHGRHRAGATGQIDGEVEMKRDVATKLERGGRMHGEGPRAINVGATLGHENSSLESMA